VNLVERRGNDLLIRHIKDFRAAFRETRRDHPFAIEGRVILPIICIAYGDCRPTTMIFQRVGG
jgi:hypothetical protein